MFGSKRSRNGSSDAKGPLTRPIEPQRPSDAGDPTASAQMSPEEAQRRAVAVARMSVAFAQVVSVLMRSPQHKHFSLADLEWMVLPPLLTGQCRVVEAKTQPEGPGVPIAVVFWASVSPEVDKRLSDHASIPFRLRPDEWKSGDILWLLEAVGEGRVLQPVLKQLNETEFRGREVKMRTLGKDGKPLVTALRQLLGTHQQPQPAT
jgi:hemolysin-activating ACP:hemolysin acyltransferase